MPDETTLKRRFHQKMLDCCEETGVRSKAMGDPYWPRRFLRMVHRRGGLEAARHYLNAPAPQPGLHETIKRGLPNLALEVVVLYHPWRTLFTAQELAEARRRLDAELAYALTHGNPRAADLLEQELRDL
jgi:hypothetical protein